MLALEEKAFTQDPKKCEHCLAFIGWEEPHVAGCKGAVGEKKEFMSEVDSAGVHSIPFTPGDILKRLKEVTKPLPLLCDRCGWPKDTVEHHSMCCALKSVKKPPAHGRSRFKIEPAGKEVGITPALSYLIEHVVAEYRKQEGGCD
jgi:hypothetical protein